MGPPANGERHPCCGSRGALRGQSGTFRACLGTLTGTLGAIAPGRRAGDTERKATRAHHDPTPLPVPRTPPAPGPRSTAPGSPARSLDQDTYERAYDALTQQARGRRMLRGACRSSRPPWLAEHYGDGATADSTLASWSMAKKPAPWGRRPNGPGGADRPRRPRRPRGLGRGTAS